MNNLRNYTTPKEHLKRARVLLKNESGPSLNYAALEMRLALEKMINADLIILSAVKKQMNKREQILEILPAYELMDRPKETCELFLNDGTCVESIALGRYRPLNIYRIGQIYKCLSGLLHPATDEGEWGILHKILIYLEKGLARNEIFYSLREIRKIKISREHKIRNSGRKMKVLIP